LLAVLTVSSEERVSVVKKDAGQPLASKSPMIEHMRRELTA
jgi:hypothetical protein